MFFTDKLIANGIPFDSFPEREKGEWIYEGDEISGVFKCSNCGEGSEIPDFEHFNFCPNCGADMRGKE